MPKTFASRGHQTAVYRRVSLVLSSPISVSSLLTRNSSFAQPPRSVFLQRGLQNGREALEGSKTLLPRQVGQHTTLALMPDISIFVVMSTTRLQSSHSLGKDAAVGPPPGASFERKPLGDCR
jgi:hypothetical protein